VNGAHAYLGAPYGVYRTADGWLALAMTPSLERLAALMEIPELERWFGDPRALIRDRDAIKAILSEAVAKRPTRDWLAILQPADIWCAEVLDWPALVESEAFRRLRMVQRIEGPGVTLDTLRGPLRIDGKPLVSPRAAPALGADRDRIIEDLRLGAAPPAGQERKAAS
jgi:crotonobetainyl-CoA:carnitine CoA-transferase CaiB-like acyl-CoA transferase